jgi:hypothetical protein
MWPLEATRSLAIERVTPIVTLNFLDSVKKLENCWG